MIFYVLTEAIAKSGQGSKAFHFECEENSVKEFCDTVENSGVIHGVVLVRNRHGETRKEDTALFKGKIISVKKSIVDRTNRSG